MVTRYHSRQQIVVVGAGVIGLSTAVTLQEAGHQVHIVADDFPAPFENIDPCRQINYASPWAGALNSWGTDLPRADSPAQVWRDHSFALKTYDKMNRLHEQFPDSGLTLTKGVQYFEERPEQLRDLDSNMAAELGVEDFVSFSQHDLPEDVTFGYSFRTWTVNPMVYCSFLLRRFSLAGGKVRQQHVTALEEIFAMSEFKDVKVVVNASAVGFGDPDVFIIRGQTCLVANDCDVAVMRRNKDGSSWACIPRKYSGGTIVGITFEPNNWDTEPAPGQRERMLDNAAKLYPPILDDSGRLTPMRDIVGRRPTRKGGMRVEREDLDHGRAVIHAYGAGGRGYELSWGVADAVKGLI